MYQIYPVTMTLAVNDYKSFSLEERMLGPPLIELHMRVADKDCRLVVTGSQEVQ